MTMGNTVIENIKKLMNQHNDNTHTLAKKCGITQPTIYRIVNEQHKYPRLESLEKIAKTYNVLIAQIIGEIPFKDSEDGTYKASDSASNNYKSVENNPDDSCRMICELLDIATKDLTQGKIGLLKAAALVDEKETRKATEIISLFLPKEKAIKPRKKT